MAGNYLPNPPETLVPEVALDIEVRELGSAADAEVTLIGELDDAGGKAARRHLARTVRSGKINLMIDLDHVENLDSSGLAALIATLRLARDRGGDVRVQASKPDIRRVMELTGLSRVFRLTAPPAETTASAA